MKYGKGSHTALQSGPRHKVEKYLRKGEQNLALFQFLPFRKRRRDVNDLNLKEADGGTYNLDDTSQNKTAVDSRSTL
jgi:hypothetical protein